MKKDYCLVPGNLKVADVSGDNLVDTIDAALVTRYILEVISRVSC